MFGWKKRDFPIDFSVGQKEEFLDFDWDLKTTFVFWWQIGWAPQMGIKEDNEAAGWAYFGGLNASTVITNQNRACPVN